MAFILNCAVVSAGVKNARSEGQAAGHAVVPVDPAFPLSRECWDEKGRLWQNRSRAVKGAANLNSRARDLITVIAVGAIMIVAAIIVAVIVGVFETGTSDEGIGNIAIAFSIFCLWGDHRLRGRHRLAWFWSTFWRLWVAQIPANLTVMIIEPLLSRSGASPTAVDTVGILAIGLVLVFLYVGLRWASGFYEGKVEPVDTEVFE